MYKKLHKHLQQEINFHHWFVLLLLPIVIYAVAIIYAKAMTTDIPTDTPIHMRVVYYDGEFSDKVAYEYYETSVLLINETNEFLNVETYEYDANKQNIISQLQINPYEQKLISTQMPSLVLMKNQNDSRKALIVVGKNVIKDQIREDLVNKVSGKVSKSIIVNSLFIKNGVWEFTMPDGY